MDWKSGLAQEDLGQPARERSWTKESLLHLPKLYHTTTPNDPVWFRGVTGQGINPSMFYRGRRPLILSPEAQLVQAWYRWQVLPTVSVRPFRSTGVEAVIDVLVNSATSSWEYSLWSKRIN
jgi:hypothetical protein